jgi:hypothetical protein
MPAAGNQPISRLAVVCYFHSNLGSGCSTGPPPALAKFSRNHIQKSCLTNAGVVGIFRFCSVKSFCITKCPYSPIQSCATY